MIKQVFTFGCGQEHAGHYVVIEAPTAVECRQEMIRRYGVKWSMQYDNEEAAGVDTWGYKLLEYTPAETVEKGVER